MRDKLGRFVDGNNGGIRTRFKKGEHWRKRKPYWSREWLYNEYVVRQRSAADIAREFSVTEGAILFWLGKLEIPTRNVSEARKAKHWGLSGNKNPMWGKCPASWRGGITPERQDFYASTEWKKASRKIRKRDKNTCQRCGCGDGLMHIHHIVSFSVRELRATPSNLILLCPDCHRWVHSKKNTNREFIEKGG